MFLGSRGLGKFDLGLETARMMLCASPITESTATAGACGRCSACRMFSDGMHPDFHLLTTEAFATNLSQSISLTASRYHESTDSAKAPRKPRQVISVNAVRNLIQNLATHSHQGGARVVLIAPATDLNVNAANALLKILEEPPGDTRFILICSARDSVPATILSRVMCVEIARPDFDVSVRWLIENGVRESDAEELLTLSAEAPMTALAYHQRNLLEQTRGWQRLLEKLITSKILPVSMAANIESESTGDFLLWLERLLCDAVAARFGRRESTLLVTDGENVIADNDSLCHWLISRPLWDIIDKLQYYRRYQQRAVDEQLFVEDVLIAVWQKI
ncbi:MAG: hypothetical protein DHS20C01_06230 [marine bacterium B5-7]|nr:MAG: hypothetical protein DHS20C01_06230 [marine bacterium B5-7]